jgi:hypothetical protein
MPLHTEHEAPLAQPVSGAIRRLPQRRAVAAGRVAERCARPVLPAAAILYSIGTLSLFQQRFDEAAQELAIAEQAFKELGDRHGYLLVLRNLAFIDRVHSLYENAESRCREALSGLRA